MDFSDFKRRLWMREYMRKYRHDHPGYCQRLRERVAGDKGSLYPSYTRSYKYVGTMIQGKHTYLRAPYKRAKPGACELCGEERDHLNYHHWNNENPSMGLWLCHRCHMFAERADALIDSYLELKEKAESEVLEAMREEEESVARMQELQERLNAI